MTNNDAILTLLARLQGEVSSLQAQVEGLRQALAAAQAENDAQAAQRT